MRQFCKFLVVGVVNTAFGYALFLILFWMSGSPKLALLVATVIGVLFNYFSTGRYVFGAGGIRALLPFLLGYGAVYIVNVVAIDGLMALGMGAPLAQLVCLPWLAILSYFINARLVFRKGP